MFFFILVCSLFREFNFLIPSKVRRGETASLLELLGFAGRELEDALEIFFVHSQTHVI